MHTPDSPRHKPADLLAELSRDGIELWLDDGQLRYRAPAGRLSAERRESVRALKGELIELLRAQSNGKGPAPQVDGAESVWAPNEMQLATIYDTTMRPMPTFVPWQGAVDLESFQSVLEELQKRHAMLRTRYVNDADGAIWAVTEPRLPVPVELVDVRATQPGNRIALLKERLEPILTRKFGSPAGALLRAAILVFSDNEACFVFAAHHFIFDAFSCHILRVEVSALYTAKSQGMTAALAPLRTSFRNLLLEQRARLAGSDGQRALEFWRNRIVGATTIFRLPYDRHSPVGATNTLPFIRNGVSAQVIAALSLLARQWGSTTFIAITTVLAMLIAHWSRCGDVAFWICDHGRRRSEASGIIGCFTTFWPLRVEIPADLRFYEALQRVHGVYTQCLPHAHVTPTMLKPELDRVRNGQFFPGLFFNYIPAAPTDEPAQATDPEQQTDLPHAQATGRLPQGSVAAIKLTASESPLGVRWGFEHSSHLFEEITIERVSAALATLLTSFAADPRLRPREILHTLP